MAASFSISVQVGGHRCVEDVGREPKFQSERQPAGQRQTNAVLLIWCRVGTKEEDNCAESGLNRRKADDDGCRELHTTGRQFDDVFGVVQKSGFH